MVSQGTAALGNLVVQVVAARSLGAAGYGTFTILLAALILLTALHGGFVGDARTVLDRHDPAIRGGLAAFQLGFSLVAASLAVGGAWLSGLTSAGGALVFGALTVLWLLEDAARRLFMTRLEPWLVVVNDVVYLVATAAALIGLRLVAERFTLVVLLGAMAVGAAAAVAHAGLRLPGTELAVRGATVTGLRSVAGFGVWRSAHAGTRPLATLLLRSIVPALSSAAALGRLEAARLLIAPVLLVINGVGSFLLPASVRRRQAPVVGGERFAPLVAGLVGVSVLYGAVVIVAADSLMPLMTAGGVATDRWAVAGWCLFAAAFAAGIPPGTALLARRRSRLVFRLRLVDSVVGLALATALVVVLSPSAAPYGLAVGALVGAVTSWLAASGAATAEAGPE